MTFHNVRKKSDPLYRAISWTTNTTEREREREREGESVCVCMCVCVCVCVCVTPGFGAMITAGNSHPQGAFTWKTDIIVMPFQLPL